MFDRQVVHHNWTKALSAKRNKCFLKTLRNSLPMWTGTRISYLIIKAWQLTNERKLSLHTSSQTFCRVRPKLTWWQLSWKGSKLLEPIWPNRRRAQLLAAGNWCRPVKTQNVLFFPWKSVDKNKIGPTEIWTRIAGFKVQSANHYTMGPHIQTTS